MGQMQIAQWCSDKQLTTDKSGGIDSFDVAAIMAELILVENHVAQSICGLYRSMFNVRGIFSNQKLHSKRCSAAELILKSKVELLQLHFQSIEKRCSHQ